MSFLDDIFELIITIAKYLAALFAAVAIVAIIIICLVVKGIKSLNNRTEPEIVIKEMPYVKPKKLERLERKAGRIDFFSTIDSIGQNPAHFKKARRRLFNSNLYLVKSYSELSSYSNHAFSAGDRSLCDFYDSLTFDREQYILSQVYDTPLSVSSSFYRDNYQEMPFLTDFFMEEIVRGLDTCAYSDVKLYHSLFEGTDLSLAVGPIFYNKRDTVLLLAKAELSELFAQEVLAFDALESTVISDMESYVDSALVAVVQKIMDRSNESMIKSAGRRTRENITNKRGEDDQPIIMSKAEAKEEMRAFVSDLFKDNFSIKQVQVIINADLSNYVTSASNIRREYSYFWLQDSTSTISNVPMLRDNRMVRDEEYDLKYEMLDEEITAKFDSRYNALMSDLIGFIPYVGNMYMVYDIINGIEREKQKEEEQQKRMLEFCSNLNVKITGMYSNYIHSFFKTEREKKILFKSQTEFSNYINENI